MGRRFRGVPVVVPPGGLQLTLTAPPTPPAAVAPVVVPPTLAIAPAFVWQLDAAVADSLVVSLGSGEYVSAEITAGELPTGVAIAFDGNRVTFNGTPTALSSGAATVTVTDNQGTTGAIAFTWSVQSGASASYIDMPDEAVTPTDVGLTYAGGVYTSSGPNCGELIDPQTAPAGEYFAITLPAGSYTGNVRLIVTANTLSSVYFHHLFLETTTDGSPIGVTTYDYDIGPLTAGDVVYCPAGVDNGPGADSGEATFSLQFEGSLD